MTTCVTVLTAAILGVALLWEASASKTAGGVASAEDRRRAPMLPMFHKMLLTSARREFDDNEEAFREAVDWQHARLRKAADRTTYASAAEAGSSAAGGMVGGGESTSHIGAGSGTFVVFATHGRAREARESLMSTLSSASVTTVAHNKGQGACFLVHASAAEVDELLALYGEGTENRKGDGLDGSVGGGLFEDIVALPSNLKIAPSLLNHSRFATHPSIDSRMDSASEGGLKVGSASGVGLNHDELLTTGPGKALHGEGLLVLLSPGSARRFGDNEAAVADRWRREWSSESLDLHSLSFWSDSDGHGGHRSDKGMAPRAEEPSAVPAERGALHAREWSGAARIVNGLAEEKVTTPSAACGWDRVKLAAEGSQLITVRELGHLLPRGHQQKPSDGTESSGEDALTDGERTACLMGLVSFLASRPEVARVSALPRAQLHNAIASRIVQSGSETRTPLWDRGIDGSGEVIQVVDSGVSEGSCFFRHSESSASVEHGYLKEADGSLGSSDLQYDLTRRKVVQYIEGRRGLSIYVADDDGGHGSHVAGSVGGSIYEGWAGPNDCPGGVENANASQTVMSCVGKCLAPADMTAFAEDNSFDLDALCPEFECDQFWEEECLSDDRSETLQDARGVAYGARLAILDVGTSEILDQVFGGTMWETAGGTGARVHSASWGYPDEPCTVDDASVSFDTWAYENQEHILIFAAGNLGDDMTGCSITSPAVGKNSVAIGSNMSGAMRLSTGDMDEVSDFSAKGPTADGRIKPDVLAPGHYIFSASNGGDGSCQLDMNSGTSMSCPIAAGAAALVRQYFVEGFYSADVEARGGLCSTFPCTEFGPSGALVKAMLIHGADAMGGSSEPDGDRGFGRIHLEAAMPFEGEELWALYVEDDDGSPTSLGQVASLETEEREFVVTTADAAAVAQGDEGPGGIRVTLVWMDPPASALASVQLVHDLDLFLEGPNGTTWTMWGQCSGDQDSCTLDSVNNVERIVVPAADVTAGTWTVRVSAANGLVEDGPQSYALAVSVPISAGGGGNMTSTSSSAPYSGSGVSSANAGTPSPAANVTSAETVAPSAGAGYTGVPTAVPVTAPTVATPAPSVATGAPTGAPVAAEETISPSTAQGITVSPAFATTSAPAVVRAGDSSRSTMAPSAVGPGVETTSAPEFVIGVPVNPTTLSPVASTAPSLADGDASPTVSPTFASGEDEADRGRAIGTSAPSSGPGDVQLEDSTSGGAIVDGVDAFGVFVVSVALIASSRMLFG